MSRVTIGVDPHKRSVTIEAVDDHAQVLATGRFGTDTTGYRLMLCYVRQQWPHRRWAVEGAGGVGRPLAQRLLADGENVVDVPAKLAARVRVFDTGNARKTDAVDAHAVAMVAVRSPRLNQLAYDEELVALRLLAELIPGGAKRDLSALQAKELLAPVRPRTLVGKTLRRIAAEEIADLVTVDAKLRALKKELRAAVQAGGSHLMDLGGIGPAGAARVLADVGDVARFPDRNHFASWTGTAPLDASSGDHVRHRLSRAGNRRLNHVLHIAAIVQIRHDTEGRAYYRRKLAESKTPMEALRCLKRRLSDVVYRQLVADANTTHGIADEAGPGGHSGATPQSSAADLTPDVGSSDQPQPGPAHPTLPPHAPARTPNVASTASPPRRRARAVKVERPTGRTTLTATSAGAPSKATRPRA